MKNRLLLFATASAMVLAAGCATRAPLAQMFDDAPKGGADSPITEASPQVAFVTNHLDQELLQPTRNLFTLGPGDRLEIEILGNPGSRAVTIVGPDGKIYYFLLRGLDVWGLTLEQARDMVEKQLAAFLTQPQVTITLREVGSKYVWLMGELNKPGLYPLNGSMTLLESVALAGGTSSSRSQISTAEMADLRHSFVMRQGKPLPVDFQRLLHEGDTSQNIFLQPDDFVFVPSLLSQEVYVLGAVKSPRAVGYIEQMTLVSAIAGAEGSVKLDFLSHSDSIFTKDAYLTHVAIVRGSLARPQITVVDYHAILKGRAPDVRLEPGDIIYIPNSPYRVLKSYVNLIINTFVTTVAANQGIRAGGGQTGINVTVPVNVPITTPSLPR